MPSVVIDKIKGVVELLLLVTLDHVYYNVANASISFVVWFIKLFN